MKKNLLISIALGLLIILSGVEALQLSGLKAKLSDAPFTVSKTSTQKVSVSSGSAPSHGGGNTVASGLDNLPSMVGGC